jgi:hypothetical protein
LGLSVALVLPITPAESSASPVRTEHVYIEASDGVPLAATVFRPAGRARVPVVVVQSPYGHGTVERPEDLDDPQRQLPRLGYAVVAFDVRGTGCSGGTFDPLSRREAQDGYEVIEWAARQPWSTGRIGMTGGSYLGIVELFVARLRPPHLRAIAPFAVEGDMYRDVMYPGGILDYFLPTYWGPGYQPLVSTHGPVIETVPGVGGAEAGLRRELGAGETRCTSNLDSHPEGVAGHNIAITVTSHPFDGPFWRAWSPSEFAREIHTPTLIGVAWQDEYVGSRSVRLWQQLRGPKRLIGINGGHSWARDHPAFYESVAWFDHYLKGVSNGMPLRENVKVYYETIGTKPNFTRAYASWPPPGGNWMPFYLRAEGALRRSAPDGDEPSDSYAYPLGAQQAGAAGAKGPAAGTAQVLPGGGLAYESSPFTTNTRVAGPWGLTLYASSSAPDTDLYANLLEVDTVGNATYLSNGRLRASHRKLDARRSTRGWPVHLHTAAEDLEPNDVYRFELETEPFAHVFRKGSRVRLEIQAPPAIGALDSAYQVTPDVAFNTVFHTAQQPSTLWLLLSPEKAKVPPPPACGSLLNQPCRPAGPLR